MIKSAEQTIWVREADGTLRAFEAEELQAQLYGAFVRSGRPESYLAEDLALALEFVLLSTPRDGRIFQISEIESALGRMLNDAGYPEVLQAWRGSGASIDVTVNNDAGLIRNLIADHLNVEGAALERLTQRVGRALELLSIAAARPPLVMELARHFEQEAQPEIAAPQLPVAVDTPLVAEAALYGGLPPALRQLAESHVIAIHAVSRIFPSLRLTVRLTALARRMGWQPPVTEMMVYPEFIRLGQALAQVREAATLATRDLSDPLPFYLTIPDLSHFATEYLEATWPEGRRAALELVQSIFDGMKETPFKLRVN